MYNCHTQYHIYVPRGRVYMSNVVLHYLLQLIRKQNESQLSGAPLAPLLSVWHTCYCTSTSYSQKAYQRYKYDNYHEFEAAMKGSEFCTVCFVQQSCAVCRVDL